MMRAVVDIGGIDGEGAELVAEAVAWCRENGTTSLDLGPGSGQVAGDFCGSESTTRKDIYAKVAQCIERYVEAVSLDWLLAYGQGTLASLLATADATMKALGAEPAWGSLPEQDEERAKAEEAAEAMKAVLRQKMAEEVSLIEKKMETLGKEYRASLAKLVDEKYAAQSRYLEATRKIDEDLESGAWRKASK